MLEFPPEIIQKQFQEDRKADKDAKARQMAAQQADLASWKLRDICEAKLDLAAAQAERTPIKTMQRRAEQKTMRLERLEKAVGTAEKRMR